MIKEGSSVRRSLRSHSSNSHKGVSRQPDKKAAEQSLESIENKVSNFVLMLRERKVHLLDKLNRAMTGRTALEEQMRMCQTRLKEECETQLRQKEKEVEAAKERREILKIKVEGLEESRKKVRGGQRGVSCNENVAEIIANQIVDTQVEREKIQAKLSQLEARKREKQCQIDLLHSQLTEHKKTVELKHKLLIKNETYPYDLSMYKQLNQLEFPNITLLELETYLNEETQQRSLLLTDLYTKQKQVRLLSANNHISEH